MEKRNKTSNEQLLQIAYYKLLQYSSDVVFVSESQFYDFIVTSPQSSSQFAIKVFPINAQGKDVVLRYYELIERWKNTEKRLLLPVLILYVNPMTGEADCQELLKWNYGIPTVLNPSAEDKVAWNENNSKIIFGELDKVICVLPQEMWSFKKTIEIKNDDFLEAYLVYFRTFSDNYKKAERPQMNEVENYMYYLKGIPEIDYPSDTLDKWILKAVKKQYPNSSIKTSTFILNTELRDLSLYNGMKRAKGKVSMVPRAEDIKDFYMTHTDGTIPGINVDLAFSPNLRFNPNGIICQHYIQEMNSQEMSEIEDLFNTYKPLSDFMKK